MEVKSNKNWIGILFGLALIALGLIIAHASSGKILRSYVSSANWVEVPATIHSVRLNRKSGRQSTYSVSGNYSYSYDGKQYRGDRIGLSSGSDNIGTYWQDLHRRLQQDKQSNEASVFVNPDNPNQSVVDRTLRWRPILVGAFFFSILFGIGAFILHASLSGKFSRHSQLKRQLEGGIASKEKSAHWFLLAFGAVFFFMGILFGSIAIPKELANGNYAVLLILLFVIAGAGVMVSALKQLASYKRIGPTLLFLDPRTPGVGGQLGAHFDISSKKLSYNAGSTAELWATIKCRRRTRRGSKNKISYKTLWEEKMPAHLSQSSSGFKVSFLFDVPDDYEPSGEINNRTSIEWSVKVDGMFDQARQLKFARSWEVLVGSTPAQASHQLDIPSHFLESAQQKTDQHSKELALDEFPITTDGQFVRLYCSRKRSTRGSLIGMLMGAFFAGIGIYTIFQDWWPGYLFALIGGGIFLAALYILGKSTETTVDKQSQMLTARANWFGINLPTQENQIQSAKQFKVKHSYSSTNSNGTEEYYHLNFKNSKKKIRIASRIKGEKTALALKKAFTESL